MKAIIMAGGGGTRLWPASRANKPKQSQNLLGNKTLLQITYKRVLQSFNKKDIYLTLGQSHLKDVKKELPGFTKDNYSVEPSLRDTAPAIGLIAAVLNKRDPDSAMVTLSSDHFIKDTAAFTKTMKMAAKIINKYPDYTGVLGINPTYPETGYGYINIGKEITKVNKEPVFSVKSFTEKPDLKTAQRYLKRWDYLWNSGNFIWKTDHLLSLFQKYQPQIYRKLMILQKYVDTPRWPQVLKKEYSTIKKVAIEFAILEKTKKIFCIPSLFDWTDIGHWRSVKEVLSDTAEDNVIRGRHLGIDTKGSLIYNLSDKLITTAGIEDMIIVNTKDAILICPKDKAQDVREIVKKIKKKGYRKYL
ncbi:MAG: sugar phosphate nucleotidyltransferase [Patescibacteria group bacterium]